MRGQSQRAELGWALFGGALASVALFAMTIGVGRVGDFQALRLIEAVLPTARFMASSAVAAAVTVLALLLTLLGLSLNSEFRFGASLVSTPSPRGKRCTHNRKAMHVHRHWWADSADTHIDLALLRSPQYPYRRLHQRREKEHSK